MKNNVVIAPVEQVLLAAILLMFVMFTAGFFAGNSNGEHKMERKAVKVGMGQYVLMGEDGEYPKTVFVWKTDLVK